MPVFSVDNMIEFIRDTWRQEEATTLSEEVVKRYLRGAIRHVETFDYSQDNEYTYSEDDVTFSTVPSNLSMMLYAYKALELLQKAAINGDLIDGELGVTWRSGMETIGTGGQGNLAVSLNKNFAEEYKTALRNSRMKGHTPTRFDIYDDL